MKKKIETEYGDYYATSDGDIILEKPFYYFTKTGKKFRNNNSGVLKTTMSNSGYKQVRIHGREKQYVHRLVAEAFYGKHDDMFVDHLDGNKLNNNKNNLEWVTPIENAHRAWKMGLGNRDSLKRKRRAPINAQKGKHKRIKNTYAVYNENGELFKLINKEDIVNHDHDYFNIPHEINSRITHKNMFWRTQENLINRFGYVPDKIELVGAMNNPSSRKKVYYKTSKSGGVEIFYSQKDINIKINKVIKSFNTGEPDINGDSWFIDIDSTTK